MEMMEIQLLEMMRWQALGIDHEIGCSWYTSVAKLFYIYSTSCPDILTDMVSNTSSIYLGKYFTRENTAREHLFI